MKWLFVFGLISASKIVELVKADDSGNPDDLVTAYMAEYETQVHTAVKRTAKIAFLLQQMEVPWNLTVRQFVEMPPRRRVSGPRPSRKNFR
jgi:ABC-type lipoprotein export system ATPase subunit